MLSKTIVFALVFLFAFGAFMALLPSEFRGEGAFAQSAFVITELTANDLIVYKNQGADNMTHGYSSLEDAPFPPQWNASLPSGEYLEVWWNQETIYGTWVVELRHVYTAWFGWGQKEALTWFYTNGTQCQTVWDFMLTKGNLVQAWNPDTNSSVFVAKSAQVSVSMFFKPWGYDTIGESYDNGALQYGLSYEWNAEASGFSVLSLLAKVLFFQGLNLGISGAYGDLLNSLLGTFFWIVLAFAVYKIFAGLIPWMSGGSGD